MLDNRVSSDDGSVSISSPPAGQIPEGSVSIVYTCPAASATLGRQSWIKPAYTVFHIGSEVTAYLYQD